MNDLNLFPTRPDQIDQALDISGTSLFSSVKQESILLKPKAKSDLL